jgi:hypothetical protein
MDEKEARDDLTQDEREQMEETGETPEEAHREGEFEDLRNMLENLTAKVEGLYDLVNDRIDAVAASMVETGTTVADADADGDIDTVIMDGDSDVADILDELDLDMSDVDTPERSVFI